MNRPPPYFPQNQLSPPDPNRYRKFKVVVAVIALAVLGIVVGLGVALYRLIQWLVG
jgi:hypothetical protein